MDTNLEYSKDFQSVTNFERTGKFCESRCKILPVIANPKVNLHFSEETKNEKQMWYHSFKSKNFQRTNTRIVSWWCNVSSRKKSELRSMFFFRLTDTFARQKGFEIFIDALHISA